MPKSPGKPRAQGDAPKKRWTAEQKASRDAAKAAAKGPKGAKGPRADRGKAPKTERYDKGARPDRDGAERPRRDWEPRSSNPERTSAQPRWGAVPDVRRDDRRDDRGAGTGGRGLRSDRGDAPRRADWGTSDRGRPSYDRDSRPGRGSRPSYDDRTSRSRYDDRGPRSTYEGSDRPRWNRDRPARSDGPVRGDRQQGFRPTPDDRTYRREERSDRPYENRESRDAAPYRDRSERREPPFRRGPEGRHHYQPSRPGDRAPRRTERVSPEPDHMEWVARRQEKHVEQASTGFSDLGLPDALVDALAADGITEPFPIQAATIADALAGRDLLGRAKTGSGKTLGFGLPMLARLADEPGGLGVRGIVLVPTRELALQVADVLAPLAQALGMSCALVAGGMAYGPQLRAFERGVDVVVATPGRLIDLMEQGAADLSQVAITVLDEADHMADLGFWPAVTTIVDATPREGQRLLFSATLDEAIDALVTRYLTDPVTHEVDPDTASVGTMTHAFWLVAPHHKNEMTARVAGRGGRTLVFVRTQMGADRVATQLRAAGVLAGALHGGLSQGARSRILAAFRDGTLPVLVATDVAARGIHVDDVSLVLQLDPPMTHKDYLHRAGRTARAGESGTVVSLVLPHQRRTVLRLAGMAGTHPKLESVEPTSEAVTAVAGEPTERTPIAEEDFATLVAPKPAVRRPRPAAKAPRQFRRPRGDRRDR